jgi:magnesium chelatase accessory protein
VLNKLLVGIAFQPDVIGGHSAGAAIAVQMALGHCNPSGLVSINGAFLPFGSVAAPIFSKAAGWLAKAQLFQQATALHGYFRRPITKLLAETGSHPDEQMIHAYQRLMRRPEHIRGTLQMMAAWDLKPLTSQLSALRTPIELVVCANDKTVSPWQSQRLAELVVNATLTEIPGLGHLGHEEQPRRFVDIFSRLNTPAKR